MKTIEDIALEVLVSKKGDINNGDFVKLTKEFKITAKKISMIRIKAFVEMAQIPQLKEFVLGMNKKSEVIPYDTIFDYMEKMDRAIVLPN